MKSYSNVVVHEYFISIRFQLSKTNSNPIMILGPKIIKQFSKKAKQTKY